MATAAFNTASSEPYTREQRIDRQGKQLVVDLEVSLSLKEFRDYALNTFFSRFNIEQDPMGESTILALKTLRDAFNFAVGQSEAQVAYSQSDLATLLEAPNAREH